MAAEQKKVYLITGASRGLGAELTSQLLKRGQARVLAGARNVKNAAILQRLSQDYPKDLHLLNLDVNDEQSIKAAAEAAKSFCPQGIDVLVNNAGIAGSEGPKMTLDQSKEDLMNVFQTNVVGARLVSAHFLPLLQQGRSKQIFNMSSGGGSCGAIASLIRLDLDNPWAVYRGRFASYAISKAALNMGTDMGSRTGEEIAALSAKSSAQPEGVGKGKSEVSETHVKALKSIASTPKPTLTVADSVAGILAVMDKVTQDDTAKFLNWQGEDVPW